jgi:hypothetical protein
MDALTEKAWDWDPRLGKIARLVLWQAATCYEGGQVLSGKGYGVWVRLFCRAMS